jgi:acetyl/propionyl-CoA carboxylase alpha subunit
MFANVLIANRGEIACRVVRTARRVGMRTIALATPADRGALHTRLADEAHEIGVGAEGYLDGEAIVALAKRVGGGGGREAESGEVVAPMHGRVIAISIEEGDDVVAGQRLAVVEAMKMEHALVAPRSGRAERLAAKLGDVVEQGQRLMTIAATEA